MKHNRRALALALAVGVIGMIPVAYLWSLRSQDATAGLTDAGEVPQFALSANRGTSGITNLETFKRVSVILNIPPEAKDQERASEILHQLLQWTQERYKISNPNDPHPQPTLFVMFTHAFDPKVAGEIRQVEFPPTVARPIPADARQSEESLFFVISPESRFRAVIPASQSDAGRALQQMVSRLNADSYLYHYLALQSLIWRQAKSYIRGEEVKTEL